MAEETRTLLYKADPTETPPTLTPPITLLKDGLPAHPGTLLRSKMDAVGIGASALARKIGLERSRIELVCAGKRAMSADTALRVSKFFGGPAEQYLDLQVRFDLAVQRKAMESQLAAIHCIKVG